LQNCSHRVEFSSCHAGAAAAGGMSAAAHSWVQQQQQQHTKVQTLAAHSLLNCLCLSSSVGLSFCFLCNLIDNRSWVVVNSGRWRRPELPAEWAFCSGIVILVPFFPAFNSLDQSLNSPYMQAHKQKKNHCGLSLNSA